MNQRAAPQLAAGHSASINWDFIRTAEGDVHEPYVPVRKRDPKATLKGDAAANPANFRVIGKSGPTVATGVDLGQQDLHRVLMKISNSDMRESIQAKIGAYSSSENRGAAAIGAMDSAAAANIRRVQSERPELMSIFGISSTDVVVSRSEVGAVYDHSRGIWLRSRLRLGAFARLISSLTKDESGEIDRAVKSIYTDDLIHAYDHVGKSHGAKFANLPPDAQTALMSIYYNKGVSPRSTGKHKNDHKKFWLAIFAADFETASKEFEAEFVKKSDPTLSSRRKAEMKLLQNAASFKRTKDDKSADRVVVGPMP